MSRFLRILGTVLALSANIAQAAVVIDWTTVGDPGNQPDTAHGGSYGDVANSYRISKYEITAGQYAEFLNAVADTDTYGLYSTSMWSDTYGCKIERAGTPGSYTYSVASDRADRPVNYVSFWDAARFANWLHNGQPTGPQGPGTTEDGAYLNIEDQNNFARQPGAQIFLPTENEWYKSAYYKGGSASAGYWDYATQSDVRPGNPTPTGDTGNSANYWSVGYAIGSPYYMTPVGAYMLSVSPYGTFDQSGNVWEWNETIIGSTRGLRGGSFNSFSYTLAASNRDYNFTPYYNPWFSDYLIGFRVASIVPEPATVVMLLVGVAGLLVWRRKQSGM